MVELECETCHKKFFRSKSEANRNAKIGRRIYCSLKCVDNFPNFNGKIGGHEHLAAYCNNRLDEYSPFKIFLRCAKQHSTKRAIRREAAGECSVTLADIKEQWDKQGGICPITGWMMRCPRTSGESLSHTPNRASLDRINSNKGYIKGNIQFIALMAQYAKNGWDDEAVIQFAHAVSAYQRTILA